MNGVQAGSFPLFQVGGISVRLHWSWLVVAAIELNTRTNEYSSAFWNLAEYLTLFGIVLLHEFGHALVCRQVGGRANQIVLWPLGGIAYVNPPPRPGAVLWSIAAGPLVNVFLVPLTLGCFLIGSVLGWRESLPDVNHYLLTVVVMNISLLVFNLLPVYPLDGGQILQALLWFVVGQARSLMIVSVIGIIAGGSLVLLALAVRGFWLGLIAAFVVLRAISGFQQARILQRLAQMPRHEDLVCPFCGRSPIKGDFWTCHICHQRFDTFEHRAVCPNCSERFPVTACPECGQRHPFEQWFPARRADTCSG
ncbi:MAG TPA: site-2 protease family protein [Gemmataceae bacterium]|nr:site-2 protease family protein [Gemmataceae bacterium]